MKKPASLTKTNWQKYIALALKPLPDSHIKTTKESPWQCAFCRSHRAQVHLLTGQPVCRECTRAPQDSIVPGPSLDLSRAWQRATAFRGEDVLGVVAVVAGGRVVSPMASAQFSLGMPADEFLRTLQKLVLTARGLTRDDYGIWRRSDGARLDGTDAMDLLLGIPGMWSAEQIRCFDDGEPVRAESNGGRDPSAEATVSR
jgi:hypothetical protein